MNTTKMTWILLGVFLPLGSATANLQTNLLGYYDFEETGTAGLSNKAAGATDYQAVRIGTTFPDWATGGNATGPGFSGNASFTAGGASGTSDRSVTHTGNALNLDDDRDESVRIPIGTTQLGTSFSISAWHALTPGSLNASNRYHLFESETGYDVSWGTTATSFTTPQPNYQYFAYLGEGLGFGPAGVGSQTWHHVVHSVSSNGTTSTLKLYVDGVLSGTRTAATDQIVFDALLLGRQRTNVTGDRDWDGMIDEVAVWNRALTDNDVAELYQRGTNGFTLDDDLAVAGKAFINVNPSDPTLGETLGTGLYPLDESIGIAASPRAGVIFGGWSSPFTGKPDFFEHLVKGSLEVTANFTKDLADGDGDGLSNYDEQAVYFTDPADADTDDDLIKDGEEVTITKTSPLTSQLEVVDYIRTAYPGGVNPQDTVVVRNSANNTVTVKLRPRASTNLGNWTSIPASTPGVSASAVGGAFRLQVPATTDTRRFFQFATGAP